VCQQEVPAEANLTAMCLANRAGVPVIYNPAPVGDGVPEEAYSLVDVLCPNEHEAALLTGRAADGRLDAVEVAGELRGRGARNVVVTLGDRGCLVLCAEGRVSHVPATPVTAVDTTGAGDAFIGSLAHFLARGHRLAEAARRASRVAAISVRYPGTQASFPRAADLPADVTG
jgi:ribokinase